MLQNTARIDRFLREGGKSRTGGNDRSERIFTRKLGEAQISKGRPSPILDAADRNRAAIGRAFTAMVETVRRAVPLADVAALRARGDSSGLFQALDLENRTRKAAEGAGVPPDEISFLESLQRAFKAGAEAEMTALGGVAVRKASIGASIGFDLFNPETVNFLRTYAFDLIREISQKTRLVIQDIVIEAFEEGMHPYEQAREIRASIGLTQTQARAVRNFRKALRGDANQMREALTRALRDQRFDPTILRAINMGKKLTREQVDKMVNRYYERYLKYRAETIARTESLRASNMGQKALWNQAREQGLLPDEARRVWILTPDGRLCDRCRPIPRLNPKGVPLDEPFATPDGPADSPPLHPDCRCTVGLEFGEAK